MVSKEELRGYLELAKEFNITGMTVGRISFTRMVDFVGSFDADNAPEPEAKEYKDPTEELLDMDLFGDNTERDPEA